MLLQLATVRTWKWSHSQAVSIYNQAGCQPDPVEICSNSHHYKKIEVKNGAGVAQYMVATVMIIDQKDFLFLLYLRHPITSGTGNGLLPAVEMTSDALSKLGLSAVNIFRSRSLD